MLGLLLAALLGGCTHLQMGTADPPEVTVTSLKATELSLFRQRFIVGVRVRNPNGFVLPISGLDYHLDLNGQEFASGSCRQQVEVPSFGARLVAVPITSTLLTSFNRIQRWRHQPPDMLEYRLTGQIRVAGTPIALPFRHSGRVSLDGQGDKGPDSKTMPARFGIGRPLVAGE